MRTELKDSPVSLASKRVLVVIAETDQRSAIARSLEKWHVTAYVASSSYEALGMSTHEAPFDVAVISHPLADMDSGKLAQSLREHNEQLPLLRLSRAPLSAEESTAWPNAAGNMLSFVGAITSGQLQQALQRCISSAEASSPNASSEPTPEFLGQVPSSASLAGPLIDRQILETMAAPLGGLTRAWLIPFLELYSQESNRLMQQLRAACQAQNSNDISFSAHTLGSISGALGLMQVSQCSRYLEKCGRTQQLQTVEEVLSQLESVFEPSVRALQELASSLPME